MTLLYEQLIHLTLITLRTNMQLLSNAQHAYRSFIVTSWFDTVYNAVAHWMNFRTNQLHEHDLQLSDYNNYKYVDPNIMCFWYYLQFFNLTLNNS